MNTRFERIAESIYRTDPHLIKINLSIEKGSDEPYAFCEIKIKNSDKMSMRFESNFKSKLEEKLKLYFDFFEIRNIKFNSYSQELAFDINFKENLKDDGNEIKAFATDLKKAVVDTFYDMAIEEPIYLSRYNLVITKINGQRVYI